MDYKNGKIYRIICEETGRQYIGSTCSTLVKRLSIHKKKGNKASCKDFINPKIFLIEDYPCERKDQLLMRERYHMENTECVNLNRPIVSKEERKQYLKQYCKQYNIVNAQEITCECGKIISHKSIERHKKTKRHFSLLEQ